MAQEHFLKTGLKALLLRLGLYYKINDYRFRNSEWGGLKDRSQKQVYSTFLTKDDIVFDVGANVGQRSRIFSSLCRKVVAIEPQSECVKHLKSRFMFSDNVVIENIALGHQEGEALIYQSDASTISSMSPKFIEKMGQAIFRDNSWSEGVPVKLTTLDHLIAVHGLPKFIKIDVEGYELNVLSGLSRVVPYISFEFNPELTDETEKCVQRLNSISAAYRYNYCVGEKLDFVLEKPVDHLTFLNEVLPDIKRQYIFGDVYAIHD